MGNHHHRVTKMPYQEVEEVVEEEAVAATFAPSSTSHIIRPFQMLGAQPRDLAKNAPRCTNLLSFSALLAIVKDKDASFRWREVATREDPRSGPPLLRTANYHIILENPS